MVHASVNPFEKLVHTNCYQTNLKVVWNVDHDRGAVCGTSSNLASVATCMCRPNQGNVAYSQIKQGVHRMEGIAICPSKASHNCHAIACFEHLILDTLLILLGGYRFTYGQSGWVARSKYWARACTGANNGWNDREGDVLLLQDDRNNRWRHFSCVSLCLL